MSQLPNFLQVIVLILVVLTVFNIIIFVHELGHFLAARWRGLQVDRFQIWFGKPIWKKTINGVQYGLGWIPAGGFVALPQMAPMEAIEGGEKPMDPLPPISPLDKIIVAFAGPLFSILLGLASAAIVWQVGKPKDLIPTQTIGYVQPDGPAAKAGLQLGDEIVAINGEPVNGFMGSLESIKERIVLSTGKQIVFTVKRDGKLLELASTFEVSDTRWYQRSGLRQVGISYASPLLIQKTMEHSPAADAGLLPGERVVTLDGTKIHGHAQFYTLLEAHKGGEIRLGILGLDGQTREVALTPEKPITPKDAKPDLGIVWDPKAEVDTRIVRPGPFEQVGDSLRMMWVTVTSLFNRNSDVGISHLSGPIGIGSVMYEFLRMDDGWRRILAFMVLFNVNLAVLNMLPFPVLDGGHITLAILEKIAGRPVKAKVLEVLQTACAIALISLMLFVSSKDAGDLIRRSGDDDKVVFPQ
ncbi:MAG TPA: RIP metalloprotease RseP [Luteolibacter sp.]|nr:RIP metalloprotease RseP [Luteolibacter sp.]